MIARRLAVSLAAALCSLAAGLALMAPAAFAEACPNEAARSGPSAALPECRAYEMVTPADKSSIAGDMSFTSGTGEEVIPAVDGNRIALDTPVEGLGQTPASLPQPRGVHTHSRRLADESFRPAKFGGVGSGSRWGGIHSTIHIYSGSLRGGLPHAPTSITTRKLPVRNFYAGPPAARSALWRNHSTYSNITEYEAWLPRRHPRLQ